jgi:glycine/D-amino acid oxidase-like deaminating enzyme
MEFPNRVGVIGAGIAGSSVAFAAAEAGAEVTVFDPTPECGASLVPRAMVHPFGGRRAAASRRRVAAFHLTQQWAARFQPTAKTGILRIAVDEEKAELWQDVAKKWSEAGTWIGPETLRARVPGIVDGLPGGIEVPDGLTIEPASFIAALLNHPNITTRADVVESLGEEGDDAWIETETRHVVVLAGGAFSQPMTSHPIGLEPMAGSAIVVRGHGPDQAIAGHGQLTPIGDGETVIAGTHRPDRNANVTNADVRLLIEKAASTLPAMADAEMVRGWSAIRAASKDRKPVVGAIGTRLFVLSGLGSKGFLLAPWAATQLVETWRGGGELPEEWAPARYLPENQSKKKGGRRKNKKPPSDG